MATLTEVVAAVVVHSSAAAFSHFGVTLDVPQAERTQPAPERVVARSARLTPPPARKIVKANECPDTPRAHLEKA